MGLRTPAFRVEAGSGDVTGIVRRHLVSLRVTLTSDPASDTLEIELSNVAGDLALPGAEREIRVSLGYDDSDLVPMGVYYHDESEVQLVPRTLTVRATAADFRRRSALKAPRSRAFDDISLGDLVTAIAAEHGYVGRVAPDLAGITLDHVDQTAESDLHLLRRLARQYDAVAKAAGAHLVFAPRGSGRSASGRALPAFEFAPDARDAGPASVLSARYTVRGRPRYGAVSAAWQDVPGAELAHLQVGEGEPVYVMRDPYPDRAQAFAAATARLQRAARQSAELALAVPGEPGLVSEAVVTLRQWPAGADSRWTVLRAEHVLSNQGYRTSITAEPAEPLRSVALDEAASSLTPATPGTSANALTWYGEPVTWKGSTLTWGPS